MSRLYWASELLCSSQFQFIELVTDKRTRLRCNREQPCQNCTVRTEQATCKYRASTKGPIPSPGHDQTNIMQQRIDRLEGLVKTLVAKDQGTFRPNDSTPPDEANWSEVIGPPESRSGSGKTAIASDSLGKPSNAGTLMVTGDHSVYRNTSDWSDVLQEVSVFPPPYLIRYIANSTWLNLGS